jgi:hypothetical protein
VLGAHIPHDNQQHQQQQQQQQQQQRNTKQHASACRLIGLPTVLTSAYCSTHARTTGVSHDAHDACTPMCDAMQHAHVFMFAHAGMGKYVPSASEVLHIAHQSVLGSTSI